MKKIPHVFKFFIRSNVIVIFSIFVAYTMISFCYFYFHLKQDPMNFFSWWWGNIKSFDVMEYKYYVIGFEILLLVIGIFYVRNQGDVKSGHEEYK